MNMLGVPKYTVNTVDIHFLDHNDSSTQRSTVRLVALGTGWGTPRHALVCIWRPPPRTRGRQSVRDLPDAGRIPQIQRLYRTCATPRLTPPHAVGAMDPWSAREAGRRRLDRREGARGKKMDRWEGGRELTGRRAVVPGTARHRGRQGGAHCRGERPTATRVGRPAPPPRAGARNPAVAELQARPPEWGPHVLVGME
jgi:hypothetical protein